MSNHNQGRQPIRRGREAFHPTPTSLRTALDNYRAHITARNHEALKNYIDLIEKCPPPPDTPPEILSSPERIRKIRLDSLCKLLCITPPIMDAYVSNSIWADDPDFNFMAEEPGVVLKYWKFLPERLGLDGVVWKKFRPKLFGPPGPKERKGYAFPLPTARRRTRGGPCVEEEMEESKDYLEIYFEEIEEQLKEKCIPRVRSTITFPEELRRLASSFAVDGLDGPGFGVFKRFWGLMLWRGFSECMGVEDLDDPESYQEVAEGVVRDANNCDLDELSGMDKYEFVVGGGFEMGGDSESSLSICAVYAATRKNRPDFGAGSPGVDEYHWWFTVTEWQNGGYHTEFASIKGLLDWGMSYMEERFLVDADKIRASVTDEDIWKGNWQSSGLHWHTREASRAV